MLFMFTNLINSRFVAFVCFNTFYAIHLFHVFFVFILFIPGFDPHNISPFMGTCPVATVFDHIVFLIDSAKPTNW